MKSKKLSNDEQEDLLDSLKNPEVKNMIDIISKGFKRQLVTSEVRKALSFIINNDVDIKSVSYAVNIAVDKNIRNSNYIEGILRNMNPETLKNYNMNDDIIGNIKNLIDEGELIKNSYINNNQEFNINDRKKISIWLTKCIKQLERKEGKTSPFYVKFAKYIDKINGIGLDDLDELIGILIGLDEYYK